MGGGSHRRRAAAPSISVWNSLVRRRGVLVYRGVKTTELDSLKTTKRTRCASRVAGGGVPRLWQGAGPTRIAQGRRVGRLEPKLHPLGVAGQFGHMWSNRQKKCTTRTLGGPDGTSRPRRPSPRGYGECPSRTSEPSLKSQVLTTGSHIVCVAVGGSHCDRVVGLGAVRVVTLAN